MLNIGHGNYINEKRVIAIISPESNPIKRMVHGAGDEGKLVDATMGRKTRAVIVADSGHVVISAITTEALAGRMGGTNNV